jgi:hypothetical protein
VLLRLIKKAGALLLKLIGVDRIIKGPLLTGSRARVVWPLLRVTKEKRYRYFTRVNLP